MNLSRYMELNKLSIADVAVQTGYSYEDIRRYKAGLVVPRPKRIIKFYKWSNGKIAPSDWVIITAKIEVPAGQVQAPAANEEKNEPDVETVAPATDKKLSA